MFRGEGWTVRPLAASDVDALQALMERCDEFLSLVQGAPPSPVEAESLMAALPEGKSFDDKLVLGVEVEQTLVGVIDLIRDYPVGGTWVLGLLLLEPVRRSNGLGAEVLSALERYVAGRGGRVLRLAIQDVNGGAKRFWQRNGYAIVETRRQRLGHPEHDTHVAEKPLG